MEISTTQINRIFRSYQSQSRIAGLNKKANIRTIQGQLDRVDISLQARKLAALKLKFNAPTLKVETIEPETGEETNEVSY